MVTVVGLGTQDNLQEAKKFVTRNKVITPRMYWDEGFDTWDYFGVAGQPAAVLVDKNGKLLKGWTGELNTSAILAEIKKTKK